MSSCPLPVNNEIEKEGLLESIQEDRVMFDLSKLNFFRSRHEKPNLVSQATKSGQKEGCSGGATRTATMTANLIVQDLLDRLLHIQEYADRCDQEETREQATSKKHAAASLPLDGKEVSRLKNMRISRDNHHCQSDHCEDFLSHVRFTGAVAKTHADEVHAASHWNQSVVPHYVPPESAQWDGMTDKEIFAYRPHPPQVDELLKAEREWQRSRNGEPDEDDDSWLAPIANARANDRYEDNDEYWLERNARANRKPN